MSGLKSFRNKMIKRDDDGDGGDDDDAKAAHRRYPPTPLDPNSPRPET